MTALPSLAARGAARPPHHIPAPAVRRAGRRRRELSQGIFAGLKPVFLWNFYTRERIPVSILYTAGDTYEAPRRVAIVEAGG